MKMEVPQVDLPLEVLAWTKVTEDILNRCHRRHPEHLQAIVPAAGVYFRHLYGRNHESLHQSVGIRGSPE